MKNLKQFIRMPLKYKVDLIVTCIEALPLIVPILLRNGNSEITIKYDSELAEKKK